MKRLGEENRGRRYEASGRNETRGAQERVGDDAIDRYLDGEMLPEESCELFEQLRDDPLKAHELRSIRDAIGALGEPVEAPDLTKKIMVRVNRRKGLLTRTAWRRVALARYAAAAAMLLTLTGVLLVQRWSPEATRLVDEPMPVHELAESVELSAMSVGRASTREPGTVDGGIAASIQRVQQDIIHSNRAHALAVATGGHTSTMGPHLAEFGDGNTSAAGASASSGPVPTLPLVLDPDDWSPATGSAEASMRGAGDTGDASRTLALGLRFDRFGNLMDDGSLAGAGFDAGAFGVDLSDWDADLRGVSADWPDIGGLPARDVIPERNERLGAGAEKTGAVNR